MSSHCVEPDSAPGQETTRPSRASMFKNTLEPVMRGDSQLDFNPAPGAALVNSTSISSPLILTMRRMRAASFP